MAKSDDSKQLSRRKFIGASVAAAAVGGAACKEKQPPRKQSSSSSSSSSSPPPEKRPRAKPPGSARPRVGAGFAPPQPPKQGRSRVVLIRDAEVLDKRGRVRGKVLSDMLDKAVTSLTGRSSADEAWRSLLKPGDVLGIKTNAWKYLSTPTALEKALFDRARKVGIAADRIHTDDRGCRTTLAKCTALVNARPLRSHHWSGVGGCLKNYIMFVKQPYLYHPDSCADLGALWNLPVVQGKTRLNVLVMLTPLYHGRGPHHFSSQYLWPYRGLIVSTDPVAADRVGLEILQAKRRLEFKDERPFSTRTHHVELADSRHGVGVADLKRIDLVKLGWAEDRLLKD
ncbi:MAG: DUF362 domain-containing protein [bacterium]